MSSHRAEQAAGSKDGLSLGSWVWALVSQQHLRSKIFLATYNNGQRLRSFHLGRERLQSGEGRWGNFLPVKMLQDLRSVRHWGSLVDHWADNCLRVQSWWLAWSFSNAPMPFVTHFGFNQINYDSAFKSMEHYKSTKYFKYAAYVIGKNCVSLLYLWVQVHQDTAAGWELCCAVVEVYLSDLAEQGHLAELKTSQLSCILKCQFREMQYSSGKNTFFPKIASGNWDGWTEVIYRAVGLWVVSYGDVVD